MPAQKCMDNVFIFQDCIGLTSNDDHLMGEKVTNFNFSKFD